MTDSDNNKVIQTAWLTAYPRIFSDIPLSVEIFEELEKIRKEDGIEVSETLKVSRLAPELEARYKLVNRLLGQNNSRQILELASGLSSRGFIMSQDPSVNYVELEFSQMVDDKRKIMKALISNGKLTLGDNFHFEAGSALNLSDIKQAIKHFKRDQPITIINEGLLRYLTFPEKAIVAKNIQAILKEYGGVWITPDITLQKFLKTQDELIPGKNDEIQKMTNKNFNQNRFENVEQAKEFFENLGFSVEKHSWLEIINELVSPQKLDISEDEVRKMISPAVVFVLRLRE